MVDESLDQKVLGALSRPDRMKHRLVLDMTTKLYTCSVPGCHSKLDVSQAGDKIHHGKDFDCPWDGVEPTPGPTPEPTP
jgi:hypothetical protein